jgi:L-threonylcarbamoyladenylate synthase
VQTVYTHSAGEAADFIKRGGIVAFPTETVYGLGADIFNEAAIRKIFEAKRRPADNPLIAHISDASQIDLLARSVPEIAAKLISAFFPGPLTVVLPRSERVPLVATAGLDSIGIRMPRNPLTQEFLLFCDTPLVAPSANLSGRPSPTSWQAVAEDLDGRIDCILQGDDTEIGLESTVVDCTGDVPVLLRTGAVSLEELRNIVPSIAAAKELGESPARSPGMKHKHYAPKARVMLVGVDEPISGQGESSYIGLHEPKGRFRLIRICGSPEEYARSLFAFFRESDRTGIDEIYCEILPEEGIGAALMDRLRRAAER